MAGDGGGGGLDDVGDAEVGEEFDLVVIDLLWWRHTKRVRFSGTENRPELYADPGKHISSFLRGIVMFLLVAILDGWLLTWI